MSNQIELINPKTIGVELEKYKPQMEAALPRHMTADRMARIALTALRMNPKLMSCTRESFYGSLMAASTLGLEPGINGQCYLIPYGNICTLVPGWRGYMELLNRTGRAAARTEAVYDGDEFRYEKGIDIKIHHVDGKWAGNPDALTHTYAVGKIKDIDFPVVDVWAIEKILWHRDKQNKVGTKHYSYQHLEMYARKMPLLQIFKYLPSSIELANASALDVSASEGSQSLTIDMALNKEFENGAAIDIPNANDPLQAELDSMFEKLGSNPSQQKMLRESYAGRTEELVTYLKGRLAPDIKTINATQAAEKKAEQDQPSPAATQGAPAAEAKRGRGRPSKEEAERKKVAQQTLVPDPGEEVPDDSELQGNNQPAQDEPEASAFDLV